MPNSSIGSLQRHLWCTVSHGQPYGMTRSLQCCLALAQQSLVRSNRSGLDSPAGHYFFVPQVVLAGTDEFYWLSGSRPIVSPGTPFAPDLQDWIRNSDLNPDWLRIGTVIVGGTAPPTFNGAFSLTGNIPSVPEPITLSFFGAGLAGAVAMRRRKKTV